MGLKRENGLNPVIRKVGTNFNMKVKYSFNPKDWKLECSCCGAETKYKTRHSFKQTFRIYKNNGIIKCRTCAFSDYSRNPNDWVLKCTTCNDPIIYPKYTDFTRANVKLRNCNAIECKRCRTGHSDAYADGDYLNVSKITQTKEDWTLNCTECGNIIQRKTRDSFLAALKNLKDTGSSKCRSCSNKTRKIINRNDKKKVVRIFTDVELNNLREKTKLNNKIRFDKLRNEGKIHSNDPEKWIFCCTSCGNLNKLSSKNSYKWKILRYRKSGLAVCTKCTNVGRITKPESKLKMRKSAINRILRDIELRLENNNTKLYTPAYNKKTIPYITQVLNNEYNTIFIHAETPTGEFRIYDQEFGNFYYADAYSMEKNIWVEFDENRHYKNGKLRDADVIRENRIKQILKCDFKRFKVQDINLIKRNI